MPRAKIYEYKNETGTSSHLADLFGVTSTTVRRNGKVVVVASVEGEDADIKKEAVAEVVASVEMLTLKTSRDELLARRASSGADDDIAECNAFLQIQNIRKKRLL